MKTFVLYILHKWDIIKSYKYKERMCINCKISKRILAFFLALVMILPSFAGTYAAGNANKPVQKSTSQKLKIRNLTEL